MRTLLAYLAHMDAAIAKNRALPLRFLEVQINGHIVRGGDKISCELTILIVNSHDECES